MVARIPRICYGPSKSQTMLYFSNSGTDHINPTKDFRIADRGGLVDRIADHMMEGYKERLKIFLDGQDNVKPINKEVEKIMEAKG